MLIDFLAQRINTIHVRLDGNYNVFSFQLGFLLIITESGNKNHEQLCDCIYDQKFVRNFANCLT